MNRIRLYIFVLSLFPVYAFAQNAEPKKWYEKIVEDYEREQRRAIEDDDDGTEPDRYVDRPFYEKRDCQYLNIESLCILDKYTIVNFRYVSPADGKNICINSASYIRDRETGYTYGLINSPELPVKPETVRLSKGEELHFRLYFSPMPKQTACVDVIENPYSSTAFNFYKVDVTGLKHQKEKTKVVVKKVVVSPQQKEKPKNPPINAVPSQDSSKKKAMPAETKPKESEAEKQIIM